MTGEHLAERQGSRGYIYPHNLFENKTTYNDDEAY